jgi:hypothetical protein
MHPEVSQPRRIDIGYDCRTNSNHPVRLFRVMSRGKIIAQIWELDRAQAFLESRVKWPTLEIEVEAVR